MYNVEPEDTSPYDVAGAIPPEMGTIDISPGTGQSGAYLVRIDGNSFSGLRPLCFGEQIIGRADACNIVVVDPSVSSRHARIHYENGACALRDLESTNGTFVNGSRLITETQLRAGDVLNFGNIGFLYMENNASLAPEGGQRALPPSQALQVTQRQPAVAVDVYQASALAPTATVTMPSGGNRTLDSILDLIASVRAFLGSNWKLITTSTLWWAIVGMTIAILNPPRSEASIKIALQPDAAGDERQDTRSRRRARFNQIELGFRRPDLFSQTLTTLDRSTPTDAEVQRNIRSLSLQPEGSNVYVIKYLHANPRRAEELLAVHVDNYLATAVDNALHVLDTEARRLRSDLEETASNLTKTEQDLKQLKADNIDGLPDQVGVALNSRLSLRSRRTQLTAEAQRLHSQLAVAREELKSGDSLLSSKVASTQPYVKEISSVNQKLAEARARGLGDQHPKITELQARKRELQTLTESTIQAETTEFERRANSERRSAASRIRQLEISSRAASTELSMLSSQLASLDKAAENLPEVEAKYSELTREYGATKDLHTEIFKQLKATELQLASARASEESRQEIFAPAKASMVSLRTISAAGMAAGAALGLVAGLLLAVLLWFRRYAIRRNELANIAIPKA